MTEDDILDELQEIRAELDTSEDLESTPPREAFDLWLRQQADKADETVQSYQYRVEPFLGYLEETGITDLADLRTRDVKEFEVQRRNQDLGRQTLNNQFGTIRQFLQYCQELNAVSDEVVAALELPDLSKDDRVNTEKLVTERAERILSELDRYRYASRDHVLFALLWRTTARIGTIRALDVDDVYLDEDAISRLRETLTAQGYADHVIDSLLDQVELPILWPRHRPESDTPLKNQEGGERVINISQDTGDILEAYLRVNRPDVTDEYGREPLIASKKGTGRLSKSAIRNTIYILTQPCEFGGPCPHDREKSDCEAREHGHGSKCPSSRSPHKLRTGAITHHRDRGWPKDDLSKKANTSEELIEGVYDQPEQLLRGANRRGLLAKLEEDDTNA